MPWKKSDGTYIKEGQAWVGVDGTKFPSVWTRFSDSELKSFGLTWEELSKDKEPYDQRFYSGRKSDGTLIELNLADEDAVDASGNKIKDADGKQVIKEGLKTTWIRITKETANSLLSQTDWMVTRKSEKGTAIPSDITSYRDSIRTSCATIETKINDCTKVSELIELFNAKVDSDGKYIANAPIFDFPDEI